MRFLLIFILALATVSAAKIDWTKIRPLNKNLGQNTRFNSRIIDGTIANLGELPYQAAVISDGRVLCAGTLVSETIVLTAAHCINNKASYEIHLGAIYIFDFSEPSHVVLTSQDSLLYPQFNISISFNYDLGFVRLSQPVPLGEYINVVNLPSLSQVEETFAGKIARTSGWGKIDDLIPNPSDELRYADVNVTSVKTCQEYFDDQVVTPCHICVSNEKGTIGICSGDSGAPLVYTDEINGERTLIGLASFGNPFGCEKDSNNVYVRISCYIEWLEQEAGIPVRP